jgi:triosephosphate isomerase
VRPLVAGNWKMNGTSDSLAQLHSIAHTMDGQLATETDMLICFPATLISRAAHILEGRKVGCGGQDCHSEASGAHTGDISAEMLRDAGAHFVLTGHSERRTDHGETDEMVHAKTEAAWRAGLVAIVCIGETEDERLAEQTNEVLSRQLSGSVPAGANAENTVIAYEPVWAIGTGKTPTVEDVAEAHRHIRAELTAKIGDEAARMRLLYGGSVKPSNAGELLGISNVDGALVGGASLKAGDFLSIAEAYFNL